MAIYFITGRKEKFQEVKFILDNIQQLDLKLPEIQDVDAKKIIHYKLLSAIELYPNLELIVEDTSLYLDALNGLPGPLIKWFLEKLGNEGIHDIVSQLNDRRAEAKTIIGYSRNNDIYFFEGSIRGEIVYPRGERGFGWDPIFQPQDYDKTFGEMTNEEKYKISMRTIAANKLKEFLTK